MGLQEKLMHEVKALGFVTLYFGCWTAALVVFKKLILAEYQIEFYGLSKAVVGTLVLSKVVLLLEHVQFGAWVRKRPAWVDVLIRTALYAGGVFVVLWIERAVEGRHDYGGFAHSLVAVLRQVDVKQLAANTMFMSGALLGYNVLHVMQKRLGKGKLRHLLLTPIPEELGEELRTPN